METAPAESPKQIRVVSLTVANVKRIKAARVEPAADADLVLIGGQNDQGKSSLLDAMIAVLGGKDASPDKPVRKGAKKGEVVLDLGELVARLRFTAAGGRELIVEDKDGVRQASPQAIMDKLTGKVGFDAEDFIRRSATDQLAILRRIVGIDFAAIDARKKTAYDLRTLANADVRTLEARLASAPNPTDAPAELVDTTAVLAEIQKAQEHNKGVVPLQEAYTTAVTEHNNADILLKGEESTQTRIKREISHLEGQIVIARAELEVADKNVADRREKLGISFAAKEKAAADGRSFVQQDTTELQAKLAGADAANNKHRQATARKQLAAELMSANARAQALTNKVDECDTEKQTLLENAKFPVKGLSFTEEGIFFEGIPFSQASSSVKRQVSVAIGAALNPTLRVMIVKDGSLLDAKSMEQLRQLAHEHNLQVWVEVVTQGADARCTVIIEDGEVVGAPKVEEAEEPAQASTTSPAIGTENATPGGATQPPKDLFAGLPSQ